MRLLAAREHARSELERKLLARGHTAEAVAEALDSLSGEGLQSDHRYVEALVRSRRERGYGPLRVREELRQRGIDPALVRPWLEQDEAWMQSLREARDKRFGSARPASAAELARQMRFLGRRGFPPEAIRAVLRESV